MLKTEEFNRTTENKIQRFLEECERFSGKDIPDCEVSIFFQKEGLDSTRTTGQIIGQGVSQAIFPCKFSFQINQGGRMYSVNAIDNRNISKFIQVK